MSDLAEAGLGGFVVVGGLERGDHGAPDVAYFGVVEDALEAVADLDPALAVLDGEEHEDAAVGLLFADLPFGEELVGEGLDRLAFGGVDGDDEDLGFGFVVQFATEGFHVGFAVRGEDLGVVVDVAGGGWGGRDFFGEGWQRGWEEKYQEQREQGRAFHASIVDAT